MSKELREAEWLARFFHETYEALAPSFGYITKESTKNYDAESPNGRLMEAVAKKVLEALSQPEEEQEPFCYFAGDKNGKPVWSEECVSEDDIFCEDEYGEDVTQSIPLYTRPSNIKRLSDDDIKKVYEKSTGQTLRPQDTELVMKVVKAAMNKCNIPPEAE